MIEFFNDFGGKVEFDFNLVGALDDLKFDPASPVIQQVLTKALQDKIMARLRELPREVIKMSEKAIKDFEKEGKLDEIEKQIKKVEKQFKDMISHE